MIKWTQTVLIVLLVIFLVFFLWYRWDSAQNRGFTFGYYGEFNTVKNAVESLPGVTIVRFGYNPDITLEEFYFIIQTERDQEVELWFSETDTLREMSGEELSSALTERVNEHHSRR